MALRSEPAQSSRQRTVRGAGPTAQVPRRVHRCRSGPRTRGAGLLSREPGPRQAAREGRGSRRTFLTVCPIKHEQLALLTNHTPNKPGQQTDFIKRQPVHAHILPKSNHSGLPGATGFHRSQPLSPKLYCSQRDGSRRALRQDPGFLL